LQAGDEDMAQEIFERSPMRIVSQYLDGGLEAGQVGVIAARAGVGKSTLLVHIGLDALLRDIDVLHVSMRDTVDHVRAYYDEIFAALARTRNVRERASAMVAAERHRMIHSYLDRVFSVDHLKANLQMLQEVAQFKPALILCDGFDDKGAREHMAEIADLAVALRVPVWITTRARTDAAPGTPPAGDGLDEWIFDHCALGLQLHPEDRVVKIALMRAVDRSTHVLPVDLDPTTMLVIGEGEREITGTPLSPRATDCTLYSGGANGAEAEFGHQAEAWGVNEVNFTFDGHNQARGRGRYELSPRELAAGDVSLVYVSRRLNRTYSEGSLIRRVLQTIWHMVSRSQQVFVIGEIQPDGTVKGGTGWSVELARMWNKNLWVYDQDKQGWHRWDGQEWVPGTPVIEAIHFTGTGTRYLNDAGKKAVKELFERSFRRPE
jgi:hypothetical protein